MTDITDIIRKLFTIQQEIEKELRFSSNYYNVEDIGYIKQAVGQIKAAQKFLGKITEQK